MTDDKIKEEFDAYLKTPATEEEKGIYADFIIENQEDKLIYLGFRAGFRTAERLAKIEVLELARQMFLDLDEMNPIDYTDSFDVINTLLEELKPTK